MTKLSMLEALSLTLGDYLLTIVAASLIMLWSRPWLAPEAMIIPLFLKVAKARYEP